MVPIVQQLCPSDRYNIKCPYTRTPRYVVIHNTANDAPAVNEITYMIRRPEEVSFHFAVDDKEIRQGLPLDRNAWASSDGTGPGNMYGIHIEICYSLSGGSRFDKSEENAALLVASLLKDYGLGIDRVKTHWDFDPEKRCPHRTLDRGWDRFIEMIQKHMTPVEPEKPKEESTMTEEDRYQEFVKFMARYEIERNGKAASKWAVDVWNKALQKKFMDGSRPQAPLTRQEFAIVADRIGLLDEDPVQS